MKKRFLIFGGFAGATAVALGAMGAHYLDGLMQAGLITEKSLNVFKTAAEYQMYHSIALLALALFTEKFNDPFFIKAGHCFITGIILFSGSLYLLSTANILGIHNVRILGPITPIGGLFFIAGWILLGIAGFRVKKAQ